MARNLKAALASAGFAPPAHLTRLGEEPPESVDPEAGIGVGEIEPGIVALRFDPTLLVRDGRVRRTDRAMATQLGTFLCVASTGSECVWTMLTRLDRPKETTRLAIPAEWREGAEGDEVWRSRDELHLVNGATLWRGPKEAFSLAAWREAINGRRSRARIIPAGLDAVRERIASEAPEAWAAACQG